MSLHGDVPSPVNPPTGCRFHTRCPEAIDVCKHVVPPLESFPSGRQVACHLVSAATFEDQPAMPERDVNGSEDSRAT